VRLRNEFTVPADIDQAWKVLLDLERVTPCLPGAQLQGGDGRKFRGTMAVKIGPVTNRYQGTVSIEEANHAEHQAIMNAQGTDTRGRGTAAATISTRMRSVAEGAHVVVETDLQISGPAAQFGRGVMQEVASKLIGRFASCLAEEMTADAASPGFPSPTAALAAATGPPGTLAATPSRVDWTASAEAAAPTRLGGYEETPVGRLPTGPAADAALAASAAGAARAPRARRTDEVLDLGEISRNAVLKRALPASVAICALIGFVLLRRARRRSR
jgi:carbon monoxide dehydrogenase subunit G